MEDTDDLAETLRLAARAGGVEQIVVRILAREGPWDPHTGQEQTADTEEVDAIRTAFRERVPRLSGTCQVEVQ